MILEEQQKKILSNIIKNGRDYEYSKSNRIIELAVKEWQENLKTNQEAYDKIYKKVVKNEHYLVRRYANMDDEKMIRIAAELHVEEIIDEDLFNELDESVQSEVFKYVNLTKA